MQVGYSNDDFYMVKDCSWPEAGCSTVSGWSAEMKVLGYVRNTALYGDNKRHIFRIDMGLSLIHI